MLIISVLIFYFQKYTTMLYKVFKNILIFALQKYMYWIIF